MRKISSQEIKRAIEEAVLEANISLPQDVITAIRKFLDRESSPRAKRLLEIILENADLACQERLPLCQDTGLVVVDIEIGQEVLLVGDDLETAVNQGIRDGYQRGFFRKSVVSDPLQRINSGDNTPAIVHTTLTSGQKVKITVMPKGAGSENMGRLAMLKPSQGTEGIKKFILETVKKAGANPCPPIIVGVGIGGNMEKAALLAKKALLRPLDRRNSQNEIAQLEAEMLKRINQLGIGPQGMGGDTTALGVNIETYPTHIASLPVAVNLGCHSTRRITVII